MISSWFIIWTGRWNHLFKDGPHNYLRLAKLQKNHYNASELKIGEKVLRTNFYGLTHENILASLLISKYVEDNTMDTILQNMENP